MSLKTSDYDFSLPEELIAARPTERRDDSRMLVINREAGSIEHKSFKDLPSYLSADDLVVLNNTRVIPARLFSNDRKVELLLLEQLEERCWKAMVKPGRKMRIGHTITIGEAVGTVTEILEDGPRVIKWSVEPDLERHGVMPLPPYIRRDSDVTDIERYQTVFAQQPGAVAAPTAGLHFTPEILAGLDHEFVTLHVGAGTFKPVSAEVITDHPMHEEVFSVTADAADRINAAKRVVSVGTTVVRVLESRADEAVQMTAGDGRTRIFIYPPYEFRVVDVLLTNFHLPKSTLLMLVSAFAGRELIMDAYADAVRESYRFYSYGDCMLIV